ncbi:MAG: type VI secretion system protein TssA [Pseudomonadota bacterium]
MSEPFEINLGAFIAPIPGDNPAGPSLRYDPLYAKIREARAADDPDLPLGEWERPLKRSNWGEVERLCTQALEQRSKDLQIAFWLCEAWVHRHGVAGFTAGVDLVLVLVRQFWDSVHPEIDDGDADARVSPFQWANDALPMTLRLHLPLVRMPDYDPPVGTLDLWERTLVPPPEPPKPKRGDPPPQDGPKKAGRPDMIAHATGDRLLELAEMADDLKEVTRSWQSLSTLLDEKLGPEAPGLGKVTVTLEQLHRAVLGVLDGRDPRAARTDPDSQAALNEPDPTPPSEDAMTATPLPPVAATPVVAIGPIANRDDAYRLLEIAASYLERTEPHSPTPYLVKRAVTWGRMSLSDLMQEILREEGDLNRYFSLLGINPGRE